MGPGRDPKTMSEPRGATYAERRTARSPPLGRLRGVAGGGLGFAALVAILVLAAPMTSAHGAVSFAPPYNSFTATPTSSATHSTCAGAANPVATAWNSTLGLMVFAGSARAGPCTSSQFGYTQGSLALTSPKFSAPASGAGYVLVNLRDSFVANGALKIAAGNGTGNGSAGGDVAVVLYVMVDVIELTHANGTTVASSLGYLVDQTLAASGSFHLAQPWTNASMNVSATFAFGHSYEVSIDLIAYAFAETWYGGATASASLNLAGTHGVYLTSIRVS
jgi:hypothetical protein